MHLASAPVLAIQPNTADVLEMLGNLLTKM